MKVSKKINPKTILLDRKVRSQYHAAGCCCTDRKAIRQWHPLFRKRVGDVALVFFFLDQDIFQHCLLYTSDAADE